MSVIASDPNAVSSTGKLPIATVNPATGEQLRRFEPLTPAQIENKLQAAADAFSRYKRSSFAERARLMSRAAAILDSERDAVARLMTTEMGKTLRSARDEAMKCAAGCRYYAENAERLLADQPVETGAARSFIRYRPLGPVLAIMPWNFPFWQVFRFAAPALMAGNVCLLKHAPSVPQCALKCEEIFRQAGFPEGVFQALLMDAEQVDALFDDARVVAATLTGSERAGIAVGVGAAKRIKKVVLELGGSDPFIVLPSADLEAALATGIKARVQNNGQSCIAAKRFIVHRSIADSFEREFVRRMQALKVGDPLEDSVDIGPLSSANALANLDAYVRRAVEAGARVLTGGRPLEGRGYFYPPTVLTDIPKDSPAYREELFGPVASLFRVDDIDQAIRLANDTRFGLGASVWTNEPAERERLIDEIESGMVFVNGMVASDPRIPFGGIKHSGHGRELGAHGIREFTNIKTVCVQEGR